VLVTKANSVSVLTLKEKSAEVETQFSVERPRGKETWDFIYCNLSNKKVLLASKKRIGVFNLKGEPIHQLKKYKYDPKGFFPNPSLTAFVSGAYYSVDTLQPRMDKWKYTYNPFLFPHAVPSRVRSPTVDAVHNGEVDQDNECVVTFKDNYIAMLNVGEIVFRDVAQDKVIALFDNFKAKTFSIIGTHVVY